MPSPLRIYTYAKCATCRKAVAWLKAHRVTFTELPIVDQPPTERELRLMLAHTGDLRRLFNTSGELYRELKVADRLKAGLTTDEAIALLAAHGKLVKRPFVLANGVGLVGFDEAAWRALLTVSA